MPALLDEAARRFGSAPAVVDGTTRLSWTELRDQARTVARALSATGVRPGDRVAVWAPNRVEFILSFLGAQCLGAALVPINTRYRGEEARVVLARSGASVLVLCNGFLGSDYLGMLTAAAARTGGPGAVPGLPRLHTVVDIGEDGVATPWQEFLAGAGEVSDAEAAVAPDTVADILYTSGTTGVPKGVMSTHRQTIGVAEVWAKGASLSPADRYAIVNPFFHSFGYKAGVVAALTAGTTIYPVITFDPVDLMDLIQRERITVLPGAPTIFTTLINHPRRTEFDLSSLRFAIAGAASVPENLFADMLNVLGFEQVAQAYGLTECVVATQSRPHEDPAHVAHTTGPAVPGLEIRTVDGEGKDVPTDADGEILIRGEFVMLGYFDDPEATSVAIDAGGWLHTGDVGQLDEHGCVKITGRLKDMFTVGGFNVYPAEVENVLSTHPDVVEAAVIGVDDERMGSVGRAYVTLREGVELDSPALHDYCRERLANFKVPREFVAIAELPRNAAGKIVKRELG
ncbi:AMP-binding protein [Amycolatopsis benzoatilytica]|uniref:AMP-binding protein n=1 Tax=Amycolatopsis benzoatilytica TaxID=346045 RepID=UPI000373EF94|nr:AMP-binding protein [Amycolatopsis benzoatilytica]